MPQNGRKREVEARFAAQKNNKKTQQSLLNETFSFTSEIRQPVNHSTKANQKLECDILTNYAVRSERIYLFSLSLSLVSLDRRISFLDTFFGQPFNDPASRTTGFERRIITLADTASAFIKGPAPASYGFHCYSQRQTNHRQRLAKQKRKTKSINFVRPLCLRWIIKAGLFCPSIVPHTRLVPNDPANVIKVYLPSHELDE